MYRICEHKFHIRIKHTTVFQNHPSSGKSHFLQRMQLESCSLKDPLALTRKNIVQPHSLSLSVKRRISLFQFYPSLKAVQAPAQPVAAFLIPPTGECLWKMAELSVTAAVVGLASTSAHVANKLVKFTKNTNDAPKQAETVLAEVRALEGVIGHCKDLILGAESANQPGASMVLVEHVVVVVLRIVGEIECGGRSGCA